MKLVLNNMARVALLGMIGILAACSSVKELTNVNIWPFGSSADAPRVYQPANSTPYLCEGNKKFFVRMLDKGASAWLILPDREVLLSQSGTSKIYTNGISKLDLSADDVSLDVNETTHYVACKANGVAKVTKIEPTPVVASIPVMPELKQAAPSIAPPVPAVVEKNQMADVKAEVINEPAKPQEPQKAATTDEQSSSQDAVATALNAWANAWRTKNADVYLSAYSAKFKPEGMNHKAWVAQRKQRVGANSAEITLVLDKVNVVADAQKAEVTFIQHYTSGKFSDTVAKVLNFENENGRWLVVKETAQSKK